MPGAKGAETPGDPPAPKDVDEQAAAQAHETSDEPTTTTPPVEPAAAVSAVTEEERLESLQSLFAEEVTGKAPAPSEPTPEADAEKTDEEKREGDTPSDAPTEEKPEDAPADPPADEKKPTEEAKAPEEDDLYDLVEEDKREKPRARKRIERLVSELKSAKPDIEVGRALKQLQKTSGLTDEETGFGLNVLAGIRRGDPKVIPLIEKTLNDLRTANKIAPPTPAEPEIPDIEPVTGPIPEELQNAVALGILTVEQAKQDAQNRVLRAKIEAAKRAKADAAAAAKARAAAPPAPSPNPSQQPPLGEDLAQVAAVNGQIDNWLKAQGVTDLQGHYKRLRDVLAKEAPDGIPERIPLTTRLSEVKAAHRAILLEDAAKKTTTPPKRPPPAPIRQTGRTPANPGAPPKDGSKPTPLADFYREEVQPRAKR